MRPKSKAHYMWQCITNSNKPVYSPIPWLKAHACPLLYPVNGAENNQISQAPGIRYKAPSLLYVSSIIQNWQDRELWLASKPLIAPLNNQCCAPVRCLLWCIKVCVLTFYCVKVMREKGEIRKNHKNICAFGCVNSPMRMTLSFWDEPKLSASEVHPRMLHTAALSSGLDKSLLKIGCLFKDTSPCG